MSRSVNYIILTEYAKFFDNRNLLYPPVSQCCDNL